MPATLQRQAELILGSPDFPDWIPGEDQVPEGVGAVGGGIFPNTKNNVLANLAPGTVYNVRIRAIGGSTQYSEWSATMSLMAT